MARVIENPEMLILKTAEMLLEEEGMGGVNMRAVAKRCGIALGTIYNYYPSKGDLLMALMKAYWSEFIRDTEMMLAGPGDIYGKLRQLECELRAKVNRFKQGWLVPELYEKPDLIEEGIGHEHDYFSHLVEIVAKFLSDEGVIVKGSDDEGRGRDLAKFIISSILGVIQQPILDYDTFERFLKQVIASQN